jgi:hypothetical protein
MITVPTTLILGAGASKPYGYPLGDALLAAIVRGDSDLVRDLLSLGIPQDVIEDFQKSLAESGAGSIDAYLARVARHRDVGSIALAHQMLHYDSGAHDFHSDWLGYIWRVLIEDVTDPKDLNQNKLSVVTFNYDTSVERFLANAIRSTFDVPSPDAERYARAVPIVHVYGSLPVQASSHRVGPTPPTPGAARGVARQLIILHEGQDDSPEFVRARELLAAARFRAFLGFGYLKDNVRRLKVSTWLVPGTQSPWGTTFGMTSGEVSRMQRLFPANYPVNVLSADSLGAVREWVPHMTS